MRTLPTARNLLIAAIAAAALMPLAHAGERVTLRNGFVELCNHHTQVDGRIRLYLGTGEDNYIELGPEEIASVESLADPPMTAARQPVVPSTMQSTARLSAADLREMLASAGSAHNLDVDLLASVVKEESGGNPHAASHAGAQGLMQLMPQTAAELGVKHSLRADENLRGGSAYLDALLTRYRNNLALALAAYNAGPAAVDRYHGIPPYRETRVYVARVIHEFNRRVLAREAQARRVASTSSVQSVPTAR